MELIKLTLKNIGLEDNGHLKVTFTKWNQGGMRTLEDAQREIQYLKLECYSNQPAAEADKKRSIHMTTIDSDQSSSKVTTNTTITSNSMRAIVEASSGSDIIIEKQQVLDYHRHDRVLKLPSQMINWSEKIQLPDSFYDVTEEDARYLLSSQRHHIAQMEHAPLRTKAMREKEQRLLEQKYPKTVIRVRFPDQLYLEGQFQSSEPGRSSPKMKRYYSQ
jgi:hypothetical protein